MALLLKQILLLLLKYPTISDNQITFTTSDTFNFDISSLNLTSSNRTVRVKFTPTSLDTATRHIIGFGSSGIWNNKKYIIDIAILMKILQIYIHCKMR